MFRRNRSDKQGGGVLVYVKDNINCKQIEWACDSDLECVGLKWTLLAQMSFTIIVIYRPPSTKNLFYEELNELNKECDPGN